MEMQLVKKASERMNNFSMLPEEFWQGQHYPSWKEFQRSFSNSAVVEPPHSDKISVDHLVDFIIFNCSTPTESRIELHQIKQLFARPPLIHRETLFYTRGCELLRLLNKMICAIDSQPTKWFGSILSETDAVDDVSISAVKSNNFMFRVFGLIQETNSALWDMSDCTHLFLFIADVDSKEAICMQDFLVAQRKLKLTTHTTEEFNMASEDVRLLNESMKEVNLTFGQLRKVISESTSPERATRKTISEATLQRNLGSSQLTITEIEQMLMTLARIHEERVAKLEAAEEEVETSSKTVLTSYAGIAMNNTEIDAEGRNTAWFSDAVNKKPLTALQPLQSQPLSRASSPSLKSVTTLSSSNTVSRPASASKLPPLQHPMSNNNNYDTTGRVSPNALSGMRLQPLSPIISTSLGKDS